MLTNITSLSVVVNETNLKQQNAAPGFFFKNYAPHCPYLARNAQSHFLALLLQKKSFKNSHKFIFRCDQCRNN